MKINGFLKLFVILFLSLFFIELVFKFIVFKNFFDFALIRVLLFSISISLFLSFIISFFNDKVIKILAAFILFVFGFYPYLQIGFFGLMGNYMSFNAASDGAGRISEYIVLFFKSINFFGYFLFLPFIIFLFSLFQFNINFTYKKSKLVNGLIILIIMFIHTISLLTLEITPKGQIVDNKKLYQSPNLIVISLNQFGSNRFMIRDIVNVFVDYENDFDIIIEEKEKEEPTDFTRYFDDTNWNKLIENETDSTIKSLHQFYINQSITPKNDHTGIFKDKNLVLIMVEAMDYLAIKEDVTPTLYKLKNEGWFFDNYYAPKYSCTTGESEYIALTSIVPSSTVCTPNSYTNNNYETALFNIFNKSDYYSTSYHNWTDQFYNRTKLHANMGSSKFYSHGDLNISSIGGWPSDLELMEKSMPYFIDQEKFFTFVISSSMHFPYDDFKGVVVRNWDAVKNLDYPDPVKYYLAKSIEFDKSVKLLLDTLESNGTLDDTVIVLFADHHPFNLSLNYLKEYSGIDRKENINMDKSPFIIYNSKLEKQTISKTASTFDIFPTLANLFDLDYDPRYYVGKDIFSTEETTVIFTNGSWITDNAMYFSSKGEHIKLNESTSDDYLDAVNKRVKDYMSVSNSVLINDYFKYRFEK